MSHSEKSICILRHGYYPKDSRLIKEVKALIEAGYDVDVICLRLPGEKSREAGENLRIYRLPYTHRRKGILEYMFRYLLSFSMMMAIVTILYQKRRYEVIQINTMPDFLVFAAWVPRLMGARILLDLHEPTPELWMSEFKGHNLSLTLKILKMIEQSAIRFADKAITVNETLRRRFVDRGADAGKLCVIRNVPDEGFQTRKPASLPADTFNLITQGTIEKRYGHEVILRALPLLKEKIGHVHLYIVGGGEYEKPLRNLSRELQLEENITFTGWIPRDEVIPMILGADLGIVAILPTPFGELCQPNKLFEHVALKKPVAVSRLRAIQESFGESCLLYFTPGSHEDLARCVCDFYAHPENSARAIKNAYLRYQALSWSETKNVYVELINGLVFSKTGPVKGFTGTKRKRVTPLQCN